MVGVLVFSLRAKDQGKHEMRIVSTYSQVKLKISVFYAQQQGISLCILHLCYIYLSTCLAKSLCDPVNAVMIAAGF